MTAVPPAVYCISGSTPTLPKSSTLLIVRDISFLLVCVVARCCRTLLNESGAVST